LTADSGKVVGHAASSYVYVDGLGDIGEDVLRDRKHLSRDGVLVVIIPFDKQTGRLVAPLEMLSRGFVETNSANLMEEAKTRLTRTLDRDAHPGDMSSMQGKVRQVLGQFLWERTHRRPMILPIAIEV
jgi:ribonuclease J